VRMAPLEHEHRRAWGLRSASFCGDHAKIRSRLLRRPTRGVTAGVCVCCLSVYLSVCLSACLPVCLSVRILGVDTGGATAGAESVTRHAVLPSSLTNQEPQPPKTRELCTQSRN
jgi:hypothetical protein